MSEIIKKTHNVLYICKNCGLKYKDENIALRCQAWCGEHQSCNLDIIKYAEKEWTKKV